MVGMAVHRRVAVRSPEGVRRTPAVVVGTLEERPEEGPEDSRGERLEEDLSEGLEEGPEEHLEVGLLEVAVGFVSAPGPAPDHLSFAEDPP